MYYPDTGEIYGVYSNTYDSLLIDLAGKTYIEAPDNDHDITNKYVDGGVIKPRPVMPLTVTGSVITGIPPGSTVILNEQTFTVNDGEADIEGYTGTVKITKFPYIDAEVEV